MKWLAGISAVALLLTVGVVRGEDLKSGPQPGDAIGAFNVTKVAGAADDGVDVGKTLCYRCRYGKNPMVMVFSRKSDEKLTQLAKDLDKAVADNSDKNLKAFVNVIGEDRSAAESCAKTFAETSDYKNVPIVVPEEVSNGPDNYGINPKAIVTVIVAKDGKVTASHAYNHVPDSGEVKEILSEVSSLLN
jgi:hypothetical protein